MRTTSARRRLLGAGAAACLGLASGAAGETSRLSAEAVAAYQLLEIVDPEAVPDDFTGGAGPHYCGTPLAVAAVEALESADPFAGRLLARALARPSLAHEVVTPSGRFRVHYDTEGPDAVDPADADGNGIPDYVDLVATLADGAWRVQVEDLGYREPPLDEGQGGGDEVDIYLTDVGRSRVYGLTHPMSSGVTGPSYLEIDNDFENAVFGNASVCRGYSGTRGLEALRVTLAHEFFHVVQFGYYQGGDGSWWQEATATWMEDVVHPGVNDYLQYVCVFLQSPGRALDGGDPGVDFHPYGSSIFAFFLDQRYGREMVRRTWEEHGRRRSASLDNFDRALRDFHGEAGISGPEAGLESAFADFSVWSWFVGDRSREGFFAEGDLYPTREEPAFPVAAGTEVSDSGAVDHMASRYLRFDPRLLPGGATIRIDQPRGRWRNRLLLAAPDSLEVLDLDRTATVRGWDAWDEVVLVLSDVDSDGGGYDYEVAVEYDPGLTTLGGPPPVAARLDAAWPNPFRPDRHGEVLIPFSLNRPGAEVRLTLYAADGRLVRSFDLDDRAAKRHLDLAWDGTNESGEPVGSGIYYAVLEAGGLSLRRALAVVRDR